MMINFHQNFCEFNYCLINCHRKENVSIRKKPVESQKIWTFVWTLYYHYFTDFRQVVVHRKYDRNCYCFNFITSSCKNKYNLKVVTAHSLSTKYKLTFVTNLLTVFKLYSDLVQIFSSLRGLFLDKNRSI